MGKIFGFHHETRPVLVGLSSRSAKPKDPLPISHSRLRLILFCFSKFLRPDVYLDAVCALLAPLQFVRPQPTVSRSLSMLLGKKSAREY